MLILSLYDTSIRQEIKSIVFKNASYAVEFVTIHWSLIQNKVALVIYSQNKRCYYAHVSKHDDCTYDTHWNTAIQQPRVTIRYKLENMITFVRDICDFFIRISDNPSNTSDFPSNPLSNPPSDPSHLSIPYTRSTFEVVL